ncbi:hypothetical protein ACFQH6_00860 [Halobacteriaceae archaeon GCM10025711]
MFDDPVFLGMLVLIAAFFLYVFLWVRRTVTGFRQGLDEGRR